MMASFETIRGISDTLDTKIMRPLPCNTNGISINRPSSSSLSIHFFQKIPANLELKIRPIEDEIRKGNTLDQKYVKVSQFVIMKNILLFFQIS